MEYYQDDKGKMKRKFFWERNGERAHGVLTTDNTHFKECIDALIGAFVYEGWKLIKVRRLYPWEVVWSCL